MILSGSSSQALSASLSARLDEPLGAVEYERFPDGEHRVRVPADLTGARAVVVVSTVSADAHVEALLLQDAARVAGATEVVTVFPYMGYARQDQVFRSGEPLSARAVARALSPGTDRVVLVNPHEPTVGSFFDVPTTAVDATPLLAATLPTLDKPVFVAPDEGALAEATSVRDAYGVGDVDHFRKVRHSDTEVEVTPGEVAVTGRDVVVVDDIVATGSTMSEAIGALREGDPARVFVTCVHPLLTRNARTKLTNAGVAAIFATDTIERDVSVVSAAAAVADVL